MTPCEKLGYKVGDRFEVIEDDGVTRPIKMGDVVILHRDDGTRAPFFRRDGEEFAHDCAFLSSLRPLKPQTEAEKRGAKFGTMCVVKATGERGVFSVENKDSGTWEVLAEGKFQVYIVKPSEIRLDHEPEYKEIPFSEATDEQRMDVRNLVHRNGHTITQIFKFDNGTWVYALSGYDWTGTNTDLITVRVPA